MEKFFEIVKEAIDRGATDIHLVEGIVPLYRIKRELVRSDIIEPMNRFDLESLMENIVRDSLSLVEQFEKNKRLDLPLDLEDGVRLRINASMASSVPTFSIRIIKNHSIDVEKLGLIDIINQIKRYNTGLILITGRVNSGKTTTLNALVQEINKTQRKKIVMLEEPIEYKHESKKSVIVQKEVNEDADIPTYYEGVINLLREDSDISIIGEIRDRKTMDAVMDLSESGGLVIGTLHTRSCGETIERILGMYEPNEQRVIKYSLSSVLKMVVSQKLVMGKEGNLVLVPEVMSVNPTIAALMRQDSFSVSEIQDAVHHSRTSDNISFERSFAKLYKENKIDMESIRKNVETDSMNLITNLIGGGY